MSSWFLTGIQGGGHNYQRYMWCSQLPWKGIWDPQVNMAMEIHPVPIGNALHLLKCWSIFQPAMLVDPGGYMWVFPKIMGKPPKSSIKKISGFPLFSPSILGFFPPIYGNIHVSSVPRKGVPSYTSKLQDLYVKKPPVPPLNPSLGGRRVGSLGGKPHWNRWFPEVCFVWSCSMNI